MAGLDREASARLAHLACAAVAAAGIAVSPCSEAGGAGEVIALCEGAEARFDAGRIAFAVDGKETSSAEIEEVAPEGPVDLAAHRIAAGLVAVHARAPRTGGGVVEAVAVADPATGGLRVVWQGRTDLVGDAGERTGHAVRFEDLNGDGLPEIAVGLVAEDVRLCGAGDLPLLFRRVFDPGTGNLRPVLARRPLIGDPSGEARPIPEEEVPGEVIPGVATPSAVSCSAGDRGDPALLDPPAALMDGDPETSWIPPSGNGAGEFVSFDVSAEAYGLTHVGVRLPPRAGRRKRRLDRPASILLATEGGTLRLSISKEHPGGAGTEPIWFALPEPIPTTCISLSVERTADPGSGRHSGLAEVMVRTEASGPRGLERLAGDLDDDDIGARAAALLALAGARAAAPIEEAWPGLGEAGRRRAVRALVESAPSESAALLAEVAVGEDPIGAETASRGLALAGEAGAAALAGFLDSVEDDRFRRAAEILERLDCPRALDALVWGAGRGGRARRSVLRGAISRSAARSPESAKLLWAAIATAEERGERERLMDLLRAGAGLEALEGRIEEAAVRLFDGAGSFEDRYRLVLVLGRLSGPAALERLLSASRDWDRALRAAAVGGLSTHAGDPEALDRAIEALSDSAPEVRIAALEALRRAGAAAPAAQGLALLASGDEWPEVRALVSDLAGDLPAGDAAGILEVAAVDPSERVRIAALRAALSAPGERVDAIVLFRLADPDETTRVKEEAARAAGARCQEAALDSLFDLLRSGAEPLAAREEVAAGISAAAAIGAIGGDRAEGLLEKARERSNPSTDRAIDAALEDLGARCRGSD